MYCYYKRRDRVKQELSTLAGIHPDFYSRGTSSMDVSEGIFRGRPYGGLAVLWRLVWFGLCCLMTPGLSKDIRCHV